MDDATGAEEDDATGGAAVSMVRSVGDGCGAAEDEDATGDCMAGDGWEQERQREESSSSGSLARSKFP